MNQQLSFILQQPLKPSIMAAFDLLLTLAFKSFKSVADCREDRHMDHYEIQYLDQL